MVMRRLGEAYLQATQPESSRKAIRDSTSAGGHGKIHY
jgi:hypothetical protein